MSILKFLAAALAAALGMPAWALGGMADLSVLDRSEGRSLPVHWHEGRAWVVGKPDNVGVIGVALFQRKQVAPPASIAPISRSAPAAAERADAGGAARAQAQAPARDAKLGTGHGRSEASPVRTVEFERATSVAAETIAIYYDSYHNLVARGVIRGARPGPSVPQPFPGFVPDPPRG